MTYLNLTTERVKWPDEKIYALQAANGNHKQPHILSYEQGSDYCFLFIGITEPAQNEYRQNHGVPTGHDYVQCYL